MLQHSVCAMVRIWGECRVDATILATGQQLDVPEWIIVQPEIVRFGKSRVFPCQSRPTDRRTPTSAKTGGFCSQHHWT